MMLKYQLFDAPQVVRSHPPIGRQPDGWRQPKLALPVGSPHMNVRGLLPLIGIKVKPE